MDAARRIVECLLVAHYSAVEILDYLTGPLGLADEAAFAAVEAVTGPAAIRLRPDVSGTRAT